MLGDRILQKYSGGNPFQFDYAVYDVKQNRFVSLENAYVGSAYSGLPEALDEMNIGRLRGDIDKDNALTVNDATEMQRCFAEFRSFSYDDKAEGGELPWQIHNTPVYISDMNQDCKRDIRDVTAIQRRVAGF